MGLLSVRRRRTPGLRREEVAELAGIGVDPTQRRRGIGSALLAPGIDASVRDRVPCALLTNTEENLAFYAGHGFEVVQEGRTPDQGPRAWMMRRKLSV